MSSKDSLSHTIKVVLGVSLVCSIVVSLAAVGLKPIQVANKVADTQENILAVSGVEFSLKTLSADYTKNIEVKYVNLDSGEYVSDVAANYEQRLAAKDPKRSIKLSSKDDVAKILRRANIAPVYLVKTDNGKISRMILPIHGAGLWSTMYAFVALSSDGNTIEAITYYDQGETPGLGGEVANPKWRALWVGKKIYNQRGDIAIKLVKGQAKANSKHEVDALSGATLTSNGVQNSFDFWMGAKGFGPYLKKLQASATRLALSAAELPEVKMDVIAVDATNTKTSDLETKEISASEFKVSEPARPQAETNAAVLGSASSDKEG